MKRLLFFAFSLIQLSAFAQEEIPELSLKEILGMRVKEVTLPDIPHVHEKGEWMLSYHYMTMTMEDQLRGIDEVPTDEVLDNYMVSPMSMRMQMHMIHAMYAPSDRVTLMLMWNYLSNSMDHVMRNGMTFTTKSSGFSDLKAGALVTFWQGDHARVSGLFAASFPVGDIESMTVTPMSDPNETYLPYPMQLGSGTIDPIIGGTYIVTRTRTGFGFDTRWTGRMYDNKLDYHLGNEIKLTSWVSRLLNDDFSIALQGIFTRTGKISGANEALNPDMVYTASPDNWGGSIFRLGGTVTWHPLAIPGLRLAVDAKLPIYQDLNGLQMKNQEELKVALTYVVSR